MPSAPSLSQPSLQQPSLPPQTQDAKGQTPHLPFLDGLRGLAALWVMIFHMQGQLILVADAGHLGSLRPEHLPGAGFVSCGHDAVGIFIVLSGFCLSLPVFASSDTRLKGGLHRFLARRAWRILPAYYAALVLGLAADFVVQRVMASEGAAGASTRSLFAPDQLLAHLLLVHNFRSDWNIQINPVFWSLAVEWQIYLLFALLLLPLWRWLSGGSGASAGQPAVRSVAGVLLVSFALGYAPLLLLAPARNLSWCCPWMLGLFTLGMVGAWAVMYASAGSRKGFFWGGGCLLAILLVTALRTCWPGVQAAATDPLVGAAALCGIVFCAMGGDRIASDGATWASRLTSRVHVTVIRFLEAPLCLHLGAISYSLYLIHVYIIQFLRTGVMRLGLSAPLSVALYETLCLVVAIPAAALFYRMFERPFLIRRGSASPRKSDKRIVANFRTVAANSAGDAAGEKEIYV